MDKASEVLANHQIALARRLNNDVIALMREQIRAKSEKEIELAGEDAALAQLQITALSEQFKVMKAANDEPGMKAVATERRQAWQTLSSLLKDVRSTHKAILKTYQSPIGRNSECATYQLRSKYVEDGLGWGTANAILDNALQAFASTIKTGQAPQFVRGDEKVRDSLTLQFTTAGGVPIDRILAGEHNEFSLETPKKGYGRHCYGEFRMRLGPAKANEWATGTWQAHRAIPIGANVAGVSLIRERVGRKVQWNIQLLLKLKNPVLVETTERQPLAVVHLGWAADSSGRRIGAITDAADAGLARLIQLPVFIEENLAKAKAIQGTRDAARDALHAQLKAVERSHWDAWPEELGGEVMAILRLPAQHVAISRLHRLMWRIAKEHPDLLVASLAFLENWRKLDKIAHQSSAGIARRARNARRDFYRVLALNQCKTYSAIVVDSVDLKEAAIVVNEVTGDHNDLTRQSRAGRVVVALHEYISSLKWAAARCKTAIIESNGKAVNICSACGCEGLQLVEDSKYQELKCPHCGARHDRKRNAAAVVFQTLCKNAQDFVEQSDAIKQEAAHKQAQKKLETASKVLAARKARVEQVRESQVLATTL